ncbi:hypothetical protein ACWDV4_14475 [Micromonospora sp. NPDC003197]
MIHLDRLIHWAQLLNIPAHLLWFKLPDDHSDNAAYQHDQQHSAHHGQPMVVGPSTVAAQLMNSTLSSDRSKAIAELAGAEVTQGRGIRNALLALPDPIDVGRPFPKNKSGVDSAMAAGLLDTAAHYRRSYHSVPASYLLPAALAHMKLVFSLQPALQPEPERVSLLTAAGEMAALAGVLLGLDAASRAEALSYLNLAWSLSREIHDVELQTVVLGCRSFALSYGGGDHRAGLECADFAQKVGADAATAETRAWVAAIASERCASLDDLAGCQARLEDSQAALAGLTPEGTRWRGIGGFNYDKLRAYEGGDMMRLRRYREAETILEDALAGFDSNMHRHQATAMIDLAEARLGLGDIDAACKEAHDALKLVTQVQHTGNLDRIDAIASRGAAAGSRPARLLQTEVMLTRADHGLPVRNVT